MVHFKPLFFRLCTKINSPLLVISSPTYSAAGTALAILTIQSIATHRRVRERPHSSPFSTTRPSFFQERAFLFFLLFSRLQLLTPTIESQHATHFETVFLSHCHRIGRHGDHQRLCTKRRKLP